VQTLRAEDHYEVSFIGVPGEYVVEATINGEDCENCPFSYKVPEFKDRFTVDRSFSFLRK